MDNKTKASILVVDDQDNWREALTDLLSNEGYTVKSVSCFDDAKYEIEQKQFNLYILDIRLVDTDVFNIQGLELLRLIKEKNVGSKVVILTGYAESIRDGVLDRYKADALILKVPERSRFNSKEFIKKIQELLQDKN